MLITACVHYTLTIMYTLCVLVSYLLCVVCVTQEEVNVHTLLRVLVSYLLCVWRV